MAKKSSIPIRGSPRYKDWLKDAAVRRVRKGVDRKIRSPRELQDMLMNAPSFPSIDAELTSIPTKEDIRRMMKRKK